MLDKGSYQVMEEGIGVQCISYLKIIPEEAVVLAGREDGVLMMFLWPT